MMKVVVFKNTYWTFLSHFRGLCLENAEVKENLDCLFCTALVLNGHSSSPVAVVTRIKNTRVMYYHHSSP